ncbi:MAG: phage integrase N-terminal SAM-like domain-containing protein, partial [Candidatus Magasanikbacteria bacterium]|nr:phage integrase N-terminal SAM-like domain-containing protein [Candidatus Magasanikbacteria bacterium]
MNKSNTTIAKHITNFLAYCEVEKGLSQQTSKNYYNFLKVFTDWLSESKLINLKPHDLTQEHIWNYRLYLSRKKDSQGRLNKKTTQNYYL